MGRAWGRARCARREEDVALAVPRGCEGVGRGRRCDRGLGDRVGRDAGNAPTDAVGVLGERAPTRAVGFAGVDV